MDSSINLLNFEGKKYIGNGVKSNISWLSHLIANFKHKFGAMTDNLDIR
jgi:hypothetical protein